MPDANETDNTHNDKTQHPMDHPIVLLESLLSHNINFFSSHSIMLLFVVERVLVV